MNLKACMNNHDSSYDRFLNFLKKHYNGLEIQLNAVCSAVDFYLKNGFTLVKNSTLMKFVK